MDDLPTSHLVAERTKLFDKLRTNGISPAERAEAQAAYISICSTISDREAAVQQAITDERLAAEAAMDDRAAMIRQRVADAEAAEQAAREAAERPAVDQYGRRI